MSALTSIKNQAYKIVLWQLIIIMGLAIVLFLFRGLQNGLSGLIGGLAYWLPTLAFVWRVFARGTMQAKNFIIAFFAGEITKLVLSAFLFVLIVKYLPVHVVSVLIGYIGAIMAFWIASMYFLSRDSQAGVSP